MTGMMASTLWPRLVRGDILLTAGDKTRGKLVESWFSAMATPEERRLFLPPLPVCVCVCVCVCARV